MPENMVRRSRRGTRRQPQGDAVTIALTIQVLACLAVVLLAIWAKRTDQAHYLLIKQEYTRMVTGSAQWDFREGGAVLENGFATVENAIQSLLERFVGGGPPKGEASQVEGEPPLAEESSDAAPEDPGPDTAADFRFDYLAGDGLVQSVAFAEQEAVPAAINLGEIGKEAPDGCSLAPVYFAGKVRAPVTGLITSEFAYRDHPVSGKTDFHNGMDIAAEEGRDILAALPGEVVETGWSDIYGNYIILQHAMNLRTFYGHCSEIIAGEGMAVRDGERIAKVGQTGVVTGPHLHFSVIVEGQFTDPYWILQDNIKVVDPA